MVKHLVILKVLMDLLIPIVAGLEELIFSYFYRVLIKKVYIPVMVNFIHIDHPVS